MRLIDADALIEAFERSSIYAWSTEQDQAAHVWALNICDNAPTIDAVQHEEHVKALNDLAVAWKKQTRCYLNSPCPYQNEDIEVKEPSTDTISRADAIEAVRLETAKRGLLGRGDILGILSALPSAEADWKRRVMMYIADLQLSCDPHTDIGKAKWEILETAFHGVADIPSAEAVQNLTKPNNNCEVDLISRDVVLANISERLRANGYGNVGLVSELNRLIGYVRNIPSAEAVQGWIPCSERLPNEEQKTYWVCTDGGYQYECRWTNVNHFWTDLTTDWHWNVFDTPQYTSVVAWMPLPTPYKGGEDE